MHNDMTNRTIMTYLSKAQLLKAAALSRLLSPAPTVVVNNQGLVSNPLAFWFTNMKVSIAWSEIATMYLQELTIRGKQSTKTYHFLCATPKDLETFAHSQKLARPGRFALLGAMTQSNAPFMIFEEMIAPQHTLDELFTQICERFQDEIQANGIEIREKQVKVVG